MAGAILGVKFKCHFSWQVQYLVKCKCHFSWQVKFKCHFSWQVQYGEVQVSLFVAGAVLGEVPVVPHKAVAEVSRIGNV